MINHLNVALFLILTSKGGVAGSSANASTINTNDVAKSIP